MGAGAHPYMIVRAVRAPTWNQPMPEQQPTRTVTPPPHPTPAQRQAVRARPAGRAPAMYQTWEHLLFLHWAVEPDQIAATLPAGLYVDTFEGAAYLGVVPFYMRKVRPRGLPAVPGISNFLELNVRTYVYDEHGTPGVWFYALDAGQPLAVAAARLFFHLPYFWSAMAARRAPDGTIDYRAHRRGTPGPFAGRYIYRPVGDSAPAEPATLPFFLAERYVLFAATRRGLASGRVHHTPYPLQSVETPLWSGVQLGLTGFPMPDRPPDHALFSPGVSVDVFALQR